MEGGDPRHARDPRGARARAVQRRRISPGKEVETEEQILDWVRRDAETALHPSCTAKMGTAEQSVVDPLSLRVHGVDGLRVVDASVFPYVTNGNIYAPVMMTAEKSADLILGNTPLEPEPVPFYRHGQSEEARAPAGDYPLAPRRVARGPGRHPRSGGRCSPIDAPPDHGARVGRDHRPTGVTGGGGRP